MSLERCGPDINKLYSIKIKLKQKFIRFYMKSNLILHLLGFGVPALVVGLTIGVSGNSYGTANFCWLSYSHSSIWGVLGPEIVCSAAHAILMMLNLKTVFAVKTEDMVTLKMVFFINAGVLPLVVGFHVTSLVMVNQV